MNLEVVKGIATRFGGRALLKSQKHSPEILVGVGIVAVVAGAIMASRATLKLEKPTEEFKRGRDDIKDLKELGHGKYPDEASYAQDLTYVYGKYTVELVKLYAPAVGVGAAGLACILGAHGILRQRNAALAAAYTVLEKGYAEYRKRVVEEYGADKDEEFRRGVRTEAITEKGKEVTTKVRQSTGPVLPSPYARFFDEFSSEWSRTPEYNFSFLRAQQNMWNDRLRARGHVFLNEIYDALGIERSKEGAVVGWVLDKNGDNFIDFGLYDLDSESAHRFVNGLDRSILLDFNVDGLIYDKI